MKKTFVFSLIFLSIILTGCTLTSRPAAPANNNQQNNQQAGIANPASVKCQEKGGNLIMQTRGDGGEYGLCYFDDNRACEEWAMFRGDCPVGGVKTTGFDTEAQKFCAWLGGSTFAQPNAVCIFKDGSQCPDDALYNGTCQKGDNKSDSGSTVEAIKQLFATKYNKKVSDIIINIAQQEGNYIRGGVTIGEPGPGAGGYFFAAKINDRWKIVMDGNGGISCKLLNSYNFPSSMMIDCYNE